MSHTTKWTGEVWPETIEFRGKKREVTVTMHHDGDPAGGNVQIYLPTWLGAPETAHGIFIDPDHRWTSMYVPFEAIKQLVFNYYRSKMIDMLESSEGEDLEKVIGPILYKDMLDGFRPQHIINAVEDESSMQVKRLKVYFDPRDLWIGVYVSPLALYICPIPMLVIRWIRAISEGEY